MTNIDTKHDGTKAEKFSDLFSGAPELMDYETGAFLRPATDEELSESIEAAKHDGGAGVIIRDGRKAYVI
jgi:hypothetical protein